MPVLLLLLVSLLPSGFQFQLAGGVVGLLGAWEERERRERKRGYTILPRRENEKKRQGRTRRKFELFYAV